MQYGLEQTANIIEKAFKANKAKLGFKTINNGSWDCIEKPLLNWSLFPIQSQLESESGYPSGFKAQLTCYIEGNGTLETTAYYKLVDNQVSNLINLLCEMREIEFDSFIFVPGTTKDKKQKDHEVILLSCECYYKCGE